MARVNCAESIVLLAGSCSMLQIWDFNHVQSMLIPNDMLFEHVSLVQGNFQNIATVHLRILLFFID